MVSFYPGPSQLDPAVQSGINEALQSGILSRNHRSAEFMQLYEDTRRTVQEYFQLPEGTSLYFVSSATECWEILSRELQEKKHVHYFNGAFGQKGYEIHRKHHDQVQAVRFAYDELPDPSVKREQVMHLTPCETSNGTQLPASWMETLRAHHPEAYLIADATSALGGVSLPMASADIWFASVQKCLGLPSGMAILLCSRRFVEACHLQPQEHYNTIHNLEHHFRERQTTHTPNTLGIYLLHHVLQSRMALKQTAERLQAQAAHWYRIADQHAVFQALVPPGEWRSDTVIALKGAREDIERFKQQALVHGYLAGNGYGAYKETTFRIANFPAHDPSAVAAFQNLFLQFK